jgi:DNA end-binding protein Ku
MAARSSWKGFLKLSLVSVPVKAYTATTSGGNEIHLNQLHAECHSRIQYKKMCPMHGEVSQKDIVSGYEHLKDQYVVIDTDELDKLRTEDEKAITIDSFIEPDALDPVYLSGKTYYLVPDGPIGQKPYAVLHEGMVQQKRVAIAKVVMHSKEQVVLLRPISRLLCFEILNYDPQITKPATFENELVPQETSPEELKLIKTLIDASTDEKFDFSKYKDEYTAKLTTLIEAKVQGKELVAAPVHEQAQIINLMDALKKSLAKVRGPTEGTEEKPEKKMRPSKRRPAGGGRKRKSG